MDDDLFSLDANLILTEMQEEQFDTSKIELMALLLEEHLHLLRKSSQNKTPTDKSEKDLPNDVPSTSQDNISKDIIEEIQHLDPSEVTDEIMKYKSPRELFKKFVELTTQNNKKCKQIKAVCDYWRTEFRDAKQKLLVEKNEYMEEMKRNDEEMASRTRIAEKRIIQLTNDLSERRIEFKKLARLIEKMQDNLEKNEDKNRDVWEDMISAERYLSTALAELKKHKIDTGVQKICMYQKKKVSSTLNYNKKEVARQLEIKKFELYKKTQEAEKYLTQSKKLNNEYSSDEDEPSSKHIRFDKQTELLSDYEICRKEINVLQHKIHKLEMRYQQFQYECLKSETEPSEYKKLQDTFDEVNKLLGEKIEYFKQSEIGNKE